MWFLLACAAPPPPTVVVIVLDTVRADAIGPDGAPTPVIDALAASGLRFTQAESAAPWTLPSHASILTGLPVQEHHCDHQTLKLSGVPTIAEDYEQAGWATALVSNNPWVGPGTGLAAGFQYVAQPFPRAFHGGKAINHYRDPAKTGLVDAGAAASVAEIDGWLSKTTGPAFLFVNLIEAHFPYDPPDGKDTVTKTHHKQIVAQNKLLFEQAYAGALAPMTVKAAKRLYHQEIGYLDGQVGAILDKVKAHGRTDPLVVLVSDHGDAFGEHHLDGVDLIDHQLQLYEELLHVPLVVSWPGHLKPGVVDTPVSLVDLADLLRRARSGSVEGAMLMGDARPIVASYGAPAPHRDLLMTWVKDSARVDALMARRWRSVRVGAEKLVAQDDSLALYDLTVDPTEQHDLAAERPDRVTTLSALLPPAVGTGDARPTAEIDALKALGYLADE